VRLRQNPARLLADQQRAKDMSIRIPDAGPDAHTHDLSEVD
jgi:hypothetical protein